NRGVGVGARIEDHASRLLTRLVQPVDEDALVVGLPERDRKPVALGNRTAQLLHVGEAAATVDLGLTLAQQVEGGALENVDGLDHAKRGSAQCTARPPPIDPPAKPVSGLVPADPSFPAQWHKTNEYCR